MSLLLSQPSSTLEAASHQEDSLGFTDLAKALLWHQIVPRVPK